MLNILHIEDEESIRDYIKAKYSSQFDSITQVSYLGEALILLSSVSFDYILLDLNLPDSAGLASIKELIKFNIPIIVLTATNDELLICSLADFGVLDYINKSSLINTNVYSRLLFLSKKHKKPSSNMFDFIGFSDVKKYLCCQNSVLSEV